MPQMIHNIPHKHHEMQRHLTNHDQQYPRTTPGMPEIILKSASRMPQECFKNASSMPEDTSRMPQECPKNARTMPQGCKRMAQHNPKDCLTNALSMLRIPQECLTEHTTCKQASSSSSHHNRHRPHRRQHSTFNVFPNKPQLVSPHRVSPSSIQLELQISGHNPQGRPQGHCALSRRPQSQHSQNPNSAEIHTSCPSK